MSIRITHRDGELIIATPYSRQFVYDLKRHVPEADRAWVSPNWFVSARFESKVIDAIMDNYGVTPQIIEDRTPTPESINFIKLDYLGRCKDKSPDEPMANGWINGGWNIIFRESALRSFFEGTETQPNSPQKPQSETYYSILGTHNGATQDEIKKAFRRMARQWHPDVNKGDPDASEMFKKINEANHVLSDPMRRKKYNFILKLIEEDLNTPNQPYQSWTAVDDYYGYRSPLKCGMIVCQCGMRLGRPIVNKIYSWDDIVDSQGRTMVSSWSSGSKTFDIHWV